MIYHKMPERGLFLWLVVNGVEINFARMDYQGLDNATEIMHYQEAQAQVLLRHSRHLIAKGAKICFYVAGVRSSMNNPQKAIKKAA